MAIAKIKDSGAAAISSGTAYDPLPSGTDQGVQAAVLLRDSQAAPSVTTFDLNSVGFSQDVALKTVTLLTIEYSFIAGTINQVAIPASGNFIATISTGATQEAALLTTVSGMEQSGTTVDETQLVPFDAALMPTLTYSVPAGGRVVVGYESNGGTLTPPTNASSTDSYNEITDGVLTVAPMSQGKIYELFASSEMINETVGNWLSTTTQGILFLAVYPPSVGGGDSTPDAFTFTDVTDQALSTVIESNVITVLGIDVSTAISVDTGEYRTNGGAYVTASGSVVVNDTVQLRHTSSATNATITSQALTIGGVADQWDVTTIAAAVTDQLFSSLGVAVASETLDYFLMDGWDGTTTDSGTLTTDASGNFTVTGLAAAAGTSWMMIKNQGDDNIAAVFPVTVA